MSNHTLVMRPRRALPTTLALLAALAGASLAPSHSGAQTPAQASAGVPVRAVSPEVFQAVSQFYDYDRAMPLEAQVIGRQEQPAYTREKVVFTGINGVRVPAYLAIPKARAGRVPVVMLIDGITGSKERWFQEDSWPRGPLVTDSLIASGIAVLALDARYHGERAAESGYRSPQLSGAPFREMFVPSVVEHRRAMDYLATRPEIDSTRIGALGLSMGGMMTMALASMDSRLRAAVAGVTPAGAFKDAAQVPVAPQTFAASIRDVPILMQMGRTDGFYSESDARQLYGLIPSARKELVWYESGHRLPPEYAPKAVSWLREQLR